MSHWKNKRYMLSRDNAARVSSIFHKNIAQYCESNHPSTHQVGSPGHGVLLLVRGVVVLPHGALHPVHGAGLLTPDLLSPVSPVSRATYHRQRPSYLCFTWPAQPRAPCLLLARSQESSGESHSSVWAEWTSANRIFICHLTISTFLFLFQVYLYINVNVTW